jgi:hypothetical protein
MRTDVIYQGFSDGVGSDFISVRRDGKSARLKHYVQHSPSGFSWGYGGSGPAEAARCILIDFLGLEPKTSERRSRESFPEIDHGAYMAFKWAVIAQLPQGKAWEITGAEIAAWLKANPLPRTCSNCRTLLADNEPEICELCEHFPDGDPGESHHDA